MLQKIKYFLFNFFHFNKQERNGVFVLIIVLTILFSLKLILPYIVTNDTQLILQNITNTQSILATDTVFNEPIHLTEKPKNNIIIPTQLFVFNPNTITEQELQLLGFSAKVSKTLINFRNKGGKFYKPQDLKKIYGVSDNLFEQLESYILIPSKRKEFKKDTIYLKQNYTYKPKPIKPIVELNTADSISIINLNGIGPAFTKRIIKYRTLLGGFHNINQLKEVYGMNDSLFTVLSTQIEIDKSKITTLPINSIDLNSLRKHPYLNFQTAQAIYNYRFKHGKLTEADIINLGIFNSEKLNVLLPYFTY